MPERTLKALTYTRQGEGHAAGCYSSLDSLASLGVMTGCWTNLSRPEADRHCPVQLLYSTVGA